MTFSKAKKERLQNILFVNSPWLENVSRFKLPEAFRRDFFYQVEKQLHARNNMGILIKGPRRIGKTELLKQQVQRLIKEKKIDPKRVLYLSLDDVQIQSEVPEEQVKLVYDLLNAWAQMIGFESYEKIRGKAYCFLDEVQSVANWDFLVKNKIERNPNVKMVLSGSAAHTLFQKSLKTLMGRVIHMDMSTFSFREYLSKNKRLSPQLTAKLQSLQKNFTTSFSIPYLYANLHALFKKIPRAQRRFQVGLQSFLLNGGFPQLWKLPQDSSYLSEQAYFIDQHYVKKVTLEDMMMVQQIKKPGLYERLLRHLFARPAQEYNQKGVARDLGSTEVTLAEAIHLIRQTDLLIFVEKFSNKAEPLRRKNLKIYPIDYGLTFGMTKSVGDLADPNQKGALAETLTAQTLARLRGIRDIAFLQKTVGGKRKEVDFYVRTDTKAFPIEVKYRHHIREGDLEFMKDIMCEKKLEAGLVLTVDEWAQEENVFYMPLWAFVMMG